MFSDAAAGAAEASWLTAAWVTQLDVDQVRAPEPGAGLQQAERVLRTRPRPGWSGNDIRGARHFLQLAAAAVAMLVAAVPGRCWGR